MWQIQVNIDQYSSYMHDRVSTKIDIQNFFYWKLNWFNETQKKLRSSALQAEPGMFFIAFMTESTVKEILLMSWPHPNCPVEHMTIQSLIRSAYNLGCMKTCPEGSRPTNSHCIGLLYSFWWLQNDIIIIHPIWLGRCFFVQLEIGAQL